MRSAPTAIQWISTLITTTVVSTMIAYPYALPRPLRRGVDQCVNGVARACLFVWDEEADLLDIPNEPERPLYVPSGSDGVPDFGPDPAAEFVEPWELQVRRLEADRAGNVVASTGW